MGQGKKLGESVVSSNMQFQIIFIAEPWRANHTTEFVLHREEGIGLFYTLHQSVTDCGWPSREVGITPQTSPVESIPNRQGLFSGEVCR